MVFSWHLLWASLVGVGRPHDSPLICCTAFTSKYINSRKKVKAEIKLIVEGILNCKTFSVARWRILPPFLAIFGGFFLRWRKIFCVFPPFPPKIMKIPNGNLHIYWFGGIYPWNGGKYSYFWRKPHFHLWSPWRPLENRQYIAGIS